MPQPDHLRRVRFWLAVVMVGLVLSGVTAFPLQTEVHLLDSVLHTGSLQPLAASSRPDAGPVRMADWDATGAKFEGRALGSAFLLAQPADCAAGGLIS